MKTLAFMAAVVSASLVAGTVSESDAYRAAVSWTAERHGIDGGAAVTGIVSVAVNGSPAYYVALRDHGALVMSCDDRLPPVLAVLDDYGTGLEQPAKDIIECTATGVLSRTVARLQLSGPESRNRVRWNGLKIGPKLALSASGSQGAYVIPGFEAGGKFTHWDQTKDESSTVVKRPLYNYYMHSARAGGAPSGGLQTRDGDPSPSITNVMSATIPCGCVATAHAAYMQCVGCTGAVSRIRRLVRDSGEYGDVDVEFLIDAPTNLYFNGTSVLDSTSYTMYARPVPGTYDWAVLPSNLGGEAEPVANKSLMTEAARELIGRVTYNCGLEAQSVYGVNSTSAIFFNAAVWAWGCKTPTDSLNWGLWEWCHEGFGEHTTVILAYFPGVIETTVRAGRPVIMSVTDGGSSGHCVLAVGTDDETGFTRVFMGHGGKSDGWYLVGSTSSISDGSYTYSVTRGLIAPSVYSRDTVPVYGRVMIANVPATNVEVSVYVSGLISGDTDAVLSDIQFSGTPVKVLHTDTNGYYRGFYCPVVKGVAGDSYYAERVVSCGTVIETPADKFPGIRILKADSGGVKFPTYSGYDYTKHHVYDSTICPTEYRDTYYNSTFTNALYSGGRPLNLSIDYHGADYLVSTSSEFDSVVTNNPGTPLLVIPWGSRTPFDSDLSGIEGIKSVSVSLGLFPYLTDGGYAFVKSTNFTNQSRTTVLVHGVSTNRYDLLRYVELAKRRN